MKLLTIVFFSLFIKFLPNFINNSSDLIELKDNSLVKSHLQDSLYIVDNQKLRRINKSQFFKKNSKYADILSSNVFFLTIVTETPKEKLSMQNYYKDIITKTHFLNFTKSDFNKGEYLFKLTQKNIDNYGKCFVGEFHFKNIINSRQNSVFVIVNSDKKEISIWDFENLKVKNGIIECIFNLRGNKIIYKFPFPSSP